MDIPMKWEMHRAMIAFGEEGLTRLKDHDEGIARELIKTIAHGNSQPKTKEKQPRREINRLGIETYFTLTRFSVSFSEGSSLRLFPEFFEGFWMFRDSQ
jgi:hypothetical protein